MQHKCLLFFRIKEKLNPKGGTEKLSFNIATESSYYQRYYRVPHGKVGILNWL